MSAAAASAASERPRSSGGPPALILAPHGRDAAIAATLLREVGIPADSCDGLPGLCVKLGDEVGLAVLTEEAVRTADLRAIAEWVERQPSWSDFPFIILTTRGGGIERNPEAARLARLMGNVTFLERPFHPTSLVSVVRTALRARQRQFEARARLDDLAEKEARLRTALKAGRLGSWELDLNSWTLAASEVTKAQYGRSGDQLFSYASLIGGIVPDDRGAVQAALARSLETGRDLHVEFRFERPDGSTCWIDVRARVLRDHLDRPARMVGVSSDISSRKRAEAERERLLDALEIERARFKTAIENMPLGVALVEPGGGIVLANPAFRDGFPGPGMASTNPGAHAGWVLRDADGTPVSAEDLPVARALRGETVLGAEFHHILDDGRHAWSMVSGIPVRDLQGTLTGALVISIDVSREKEAREALQRLADTLEQRVEERTAQLAAANEGLRQQVVERERAEQQLRQAQKMEAIGQLTGGVAHDFNNLLMAIITNLDLLLKRKGDDPDAAKLIGGALEGAHRGAALTQRLLAFARRQDLQLRPVDLAELVGGMRSLFERSAGPLVTVELDIPEGLSPASADDNQLELALLNLVVNARDAMPEGGLLRIALEQCEVAEDSELAPGSYIVLRVQDNGIGMDADTLSKAVDPFFTTKEVGKGTGLGLSMVHGLAVQFGGALRISSRPGEGTTAELWLAATEERPVADTAPADDSVGRDVRATVLLVEDDALIAMSTVAMLEDLGHTVIEAHSGEEALSILEGAAAVDLLLTDHAMPGMTGIELAGRARKMKPGLPILLVTGYAELPGDQGAGVPRLSKPYERHQLAAAIRSLLTDSAPGVD